MDRRRLPRPQRVLIVDDSDDIRHLWREWFTFWGFAIDEAVNGAQAVRMARAHPPDLILMDLMMPIVDGFTATSTLKQDPSTAHIPVLAISAALTRESRQGAEAAGCDAFLSKGIAPEELLRKLRAVFRQMSASAGGSSAPA
jgi:two-component system cell cycle response regulator DivK